MCRVFYIPTGLQRDFLLSFRRFEGFWLFDFKTRHKLVELLQGQLLYFRLIFRSSKFTLNFHAFI